MDDIATEKAINFDLDTTKLYELTGSKTKGYAEICKFLTENGFVHKQWSGYVSSIKMTYVDIHVLLRNVVIEFEWLADVVNTFDVTRVEEKGKNMQETIKYYKEVKNETSLVQNRHKSDSEITKLEHKINILNMLIRHEMDCEENIYNYEERETLFHGRTL
ncbi:MAG: hypothetical protein GX959_02080 [Clostridiales bacterium]|jgi:virulence-associated protein VapD|nr:hypothetical protein [Clostridiales bacterium]